MRKWKDDGSDMIPKGKKRFFLIASIVIIILTSIPIIFNQIITFEETMYIVLASFVIWGFQWNGFYKIARMYAEYKLKKSDNKWR